VQFVDTPKSSKFYFSIYNYIITTSYDKKRRWNNVSKPKRVKMIYECFAAIGRTAPDPENIDWEKEPFTVPRFNAMKKCIFCFSFYIIIKVIQRRLSRNPEKYDPSKDSRCDSSSEEEEKPTKKKAAAKKKTQNVVDLSSEEVSDDTHAEDEEEEEEEPPKKKARKQPTRSNNSKIENKERKKKAKK
jgi:hypothetical protein